MSGTGNTVDRFKKKHLQDAHPVNGCAFFILITKRFNLVTIVVRLSGNSYRLLRKNPPPKKQTLCRTKVLFKSPKQALAISTPVGKKAKCLQSA